MKDVSWNEPEQQGSVPREAATSAASTTASAVLPVQALLGGLMVPAGSVLWPCTDHRR